MTTWKDFLPFYHHPLTLKIKDNEKWTVSDSNKRPIDIKALIRGEGPYGATSPTTECLTTLPEIIKNFPNIANHTYFIEIENDDFIVLDVEPSCPDDIKQEFLQLPFIYGERSMSKKGYHLVFHAKDLLEKYPILLKKTKLQSKDKSFEILTNHWVTFTRDMIEPPIQPKGDIETTVQKLVNEAAIETKEFDPTKFKETNPDKIPDYLFLVEKTIQVNRYDKTLEDHHNDWSRYEFGYASSLANSLKKVLKLSVIHQNKHRYNDSEKAAILYEVLCQKIEYREKHDTQRNNVPWLLYIAQNIIQKQHEKKPKK